MRKSGQSQNSISLENRVASEMSFLEEVYGVAFSRNYAEVNYRAEFNLDRGLFIAASSSSHADSGWSTKISRVAPPYIFIASFKIFDMFVEHHLGIGPGRIVSFKDKCTAFKSLTFNPWVESRPWLKSRVISLYCELINCRNALTHHWEYKLQEGGGMIVREKDNQKWKRRNLSGAELFAFSRIMRLLVLVDLGKLHFCPLQESKLRKDLNAMSKHHKRGKVKLTEFVLVTYNSHEQRPTRKEVNLIQTAISSRLPVDSVWFDLIYKVHGQSGVEVVYCFEWLKIKGGECYKRDMSEFVVSRDFSFDGWPFANAP